MDSFESFDACNDLTLKATLPTLDDVSPPGTDWDATGSSHLDAGDNPEFVYISDGSSVELIEPIRVKRKSSAANDPEATSHSDPFVTEDEVKASLAKKEEILESLISLSPSGSCSGGSLSQLSTLTTNSTNLSAIRNRRNELMNSLRSNLNTSRLSIASDDLNEDRTFNVSTSTAIVELEPPLGDDEAPSSPSPGDDKAPSSPPLDDDEAPSSPTDAAADANSALNGDAQNRTQYEEAFASLNEILSSTTPDSILELYSSKLESFKEEDDKKCDEQLKKFFSLMEEDPIAELEEQINSMSGANCVVDSPSIVNDESASSAYETLQVAEVTVVERPAVDEQPKPPESAVVSQDDNKDAKDPENLILGEGDADEDFDEDVLLASDDEADAGSKSASKEPSKVWKEFQSTDEDENRDNNDPKWEYLKNLGSDYERYKAVQARWNNLEVPNPKRDLTCRCRNVSRSKKYLEECRKNEFGKRTLNSPEGDRRSAKRARRESCTVLFDWSIQQLIQDVESERSQIDLEQEQRLNELADQQSRDQIMARRERKNEMFIREMKQRHYMEAEALIKEFRRRRDQLTETARFQMEALRKAGDEVRQFHEFYPNKKGINGNHDANAVIYLTETEVQEILEVEKMLIRFESFYAAGV